MITHVAIARVTLETTTPLTIGTGAGNDLVDAICVTDANGLPTVPGSSIAGVLRHGLPDGPEGPGAHRLFGYQQQDTGEASHVFVSWAHAHDASDRPVSARPGSAHAADEVLGLLAAGVRRDHVRISRHGVVDGRGKFDTQLVPTGARFTFELRVQGGPESRRITDPAATLDQLLGQIASPAFRLGGRTRRGFGTVKVVRVLARTFDLRTEHAAWAGVPRDLAAPVPASLLPTFRVRAADEAPGFKTGRLVLEAVDYWLFAGEPARESHYRNDKAIDQVAKTEPVITWDGARGRVLESKEARYLVPASSVKGALRHRTEFHLRRLRGVWASTDGSTPPDADVVTEAMQTLFGDVKQRAGTGDGAGKPGRVYLTDHYAAPSQREGELDHVSIDRFTGGPMDGMLFSEKPLFQGTITLALAVDVGCPIPDDVRRAFAAAVDDLCHERLPIGAASNRGHGYFRGGRVEGSVGEWLQGRMA